MGKDDATVTSVVASGGEDDAEWWRAKRRGSAVVARVPLVCVVLFSKTSPTEERREKLTKTSKRQGIEENGWTAPYAAQKIQVYK